MLKPTVFKIESPERPLGKKAVSKLRKESLIPGVIYGPKVKDNIHVTVPELELEKILASSTTNIASFKVDKVGNFDTLLKKAEFDPVTDKPLHADFYALDKNTQVTLTIPIRLTGTPAGVVEGGRMYQPLRRLEVRCDPDKIPAEFTFDISVLNIGDSLHVSELFVEGVTPLEDPVRTIAVVRPPKGAIEDIIGAEEEEEGLEEGATEAAEGEPAEGEGSSE
ncbi:MAG: 50S ribosomal protein L25 [Balneolales bacterium]